MSGSTNRDRRDKALPNIRAESPPKTTIEIAEQFISGIKTPNDHELNAYIDVFRGPADLKDLKAELALGILYLWGFKQSLSEDSALFYKKQGTTSLKRLVAHKNEYACQLFGQFFNKDLFKLPILNTDTFSTGKDTPRLIVDDNLINPSQDTIMTARVVIAEKLQELFDILGQSEVPESKRPGMIAETFAELWPTTYQNAAAETVKRKARPSSNALPDLPVGLSWPTETYSSSPEARRKGKGIVSYLERVWLPLIKANPGTVDLRTLRTIDRSAVNAINYLKHVGVCLPSHLDIPTKRERTDRKLAEGPQAILRDARLARAVAERVKRGVNVPGF